MNCRNCNTKSIKRGVRKSIQKYYCKTCKKYFQSAYTNKLCTKEDEAMIVKLNNEGVGINGIGRLLNISKSNVINKIKKIASKIIIPIITETQQEYEVDEMHTFVKHKQNQCYIIYAINKTTKKVIDLVVGSRTKENINKVISAVNKLNPKTIFTDRLNIYPTLIKKDIHIASSYKINHIERLNLTLRTHLKRFARKTICFSKSKEMLECCLKLYILNNSLNLK